VAKDKAEDTFMQARNDGRTFSPGNDDFDVRAIDVSSLRLAEMDCSQWPPNGISAVKRRRDWRRGWDSNPHEVAFASPSSWRD
jgi:hypothetical protein